MLTIFVILAILLQVAIALTIYFRRQRGHANTIFVLLSLALASWAFTDFIAISVPQNESAIYAIRTVITFVVIQNTLFYLFAASFPRERLSQLRHTKLLLTYSALVAVLSQTPLLFSSVTVSNGMANPNPTPFIMFFMVHAVITISLGLRALIRKYKKADNNVRQKQLRVILFGSIILWLIAPITNFVLTLALHTTFFVKIAPFYTLAFGALITYAIVSQKLFDIRAALARSVGFVFSLGFIVLLYGASVYAVLSFTGSESLSRGVERGIYVGLALVTALTYPYAKAFFEKITTRLFFKDLYDTQEFLNELNQVLVQRIVLGPLLETSSKIISENLKSSKTTFIIRKTAYFPMRFMGDTPSITSDDYELLNDHTFHLPYKVVVTELLEDQHPVAARFFAKKDVDVLVRLVPNLDSPIEGVGYLALGPKRNGEPYNAKDLDVLEIIANELVIAIENGLRFEEIDEFNSTLQDKVDTATRQLKKTNEKLKQMDETKDEFISMASHQLRTPLTSVKGYVSMVLEGDAGELNDMQRKLLEQSFASSQRMVYLIADLLNLSRLRTGKFVIEAKPTNLADVIESEVDQLKISAAGRNLTLNYDKPKNFPDIMLDDTKIRQVIMNFSDNAIYYTPAGGKIDIRLKETKDSVEFTVNDNGIGIPPDEQRHLFNKFYRAKNAQKARPDGTGLGLFMAKKVIIAQGGAIVFKSVENKGSTFGFTFSKQKLKVPDHLADKKT